MTDMHAQVNQQSLSSLLAATGQIGQSSQPGQRGPLFLAPGLSYQGPGELQKIMGALQSPMPGIFGQLLSGGAYFSKGNMTLKGVGQQIFSDFQKANSEGHSRVQQGAQAAAHTLAQNGVHLIQHAHVDTHQPIGTGGRSFAARVQSSHHDDYHHMG